MARERWSTTTVDYSTAKERVDSLGEVQATATERQLINGVKKDVPSDRLAPLTCAQGRDRLLAEKARAREATAEAKRSKMLEAAERARITRERSAQEREKEVERQADVKRARQQEAARCVGKGLVA